VTEQFWTIEDVRRFLAVKSLTTAYHVAARPDAPKSVGISPRARRWIADDWRKWAERRRGS